MKCQFRDGMGQTPLMAAVAERAYRAALVLLDSIRACPDADEAQRSAAIFPPNAHPDHSPLLVLCCNDTCSFTWTGQDHINQVCFFQMCAIVVKCKLHLLMVIGAKVEAAIVYIQI